MIMILLLFVILFSIGMVSCTKELDIKYHDIDPILVIEGNLHGRSADVILTLTTPMDEPMDRRRLTDATVRISDMESGESWNLVPTADGIYTASTDAVSEATYCLEVRRGGEEYVAQTEMQPSVELRSVEFGSIKMPYDYVAVLQVSFRKPEVESAGCYWVRLTKNGKFYKWGTVADPGNDDGIVNVVFMTSRRNLDEEDEQSALRTGDVVTARVTAISREMYDYLIAIENDSSGPMMFKGASCLGYFLASPVAEGSVVFDASAVFP